MISNYNTEYAEKEPRLRSGLVALVLSTLLIVLAILAIILASATSDGSPVLSTVVISVCAIYLALCWIPFMGIKVIRPKEAVVLTLFGKYYGTIKREGMFFVNPFAATLMPQNAKATTSVTVGGKQNNSQLP